MSRQNQKIGFTLVETLIAIAILLIAIAGPLSFVANSLNAAYYARDQVTAYYLAQEGIEYARFVRDTNVLTSGFFGAWDYPLTAGGGGLDCSSTSNPCSLDDFNIGISPALFQCTAKVQGQPYCPVQYDMTNQIYRQNITVPLPNSSLTNFQRYITITALNPHEDQITVQVYWATANLRAPSRFKITEDIFDWQH